MPASRCWRFRLEVSCNDSRCLAGEWSAPVRAAPSHFERVPCYYCQATESAAFLTAQDDLTGRPGTFTFITCARCGLRYQNPRLGIEHVKAFYDHEYIAHRKKANWGPLTGFFNWARPGAPPFDLFVLVPTRVPSVDGRTARPGSRRRYYSPTWLSIEVPDGGRAAAGRPDPRRRRRPRPERDPRHRRVGVRVLPLLRRGRGRRRLGGGRGPGGVVVVAGGAGLSKTKGDHTVRSVGMAAPPKL